MVSFVYTLVAVLGVVSLSYTAPTAKRTDAPHGVKKGMAYNNAKTASKLGGPHGGSWGYDWAVPSDVSFQGIPMVWGLGAKGKSAAIHKSVNKGAPYVLGYNEPDMCIPNAGGSSISPTDAAASWAGDMLQYTPKAKLVCPAITSNDSPKGNQCAWAIGLSWLKRFVNGQPGKLHCSAQALHWYGGGGSMEKQADAFKSYIEHAHKVVDDIFGKSMPLWITEFAPADSNYQVIRDAGEYAKFLDIVMPWLNNQPYVARYSPFKAEYLVGNDGKPNAAGKVFLKH